MSEHPLAAEVVEVFPMRLGPESLVDLTLEIAGAGTFTPPRADDRVRILDGPGSLDLIVWAAPAIARPDGSRLVNVQFLRADLREFEVRPAMRVEIHPS